MNPEDESTPASGGSIPKESISKATSELNNLLHIISGTSTEIENLWDGSAGSEKYLEMLRASIERAEAVAAELAEQAGGAEEKVLMHPELAALVKPKTVTSMPISKPRILVVDDEEMALTLVKQLLSTAGFHVTTAQSGFECLDLFRRRPYSYQLVLLDLTMQFMDGEETFHRLREIRPDVPVVLCTGFIQGDRLEGLMKAGLTGYLRKPLSPDEIVGNVRSFLETAKYTRIRGDSSSLTG
jgi:CheY-like chemotaxis protein